MPPPNKLCYNQERQHSCFIGITKGQKGLPKSFYIDKTDLIREWWDAQDDVTLITRPRRFGKTLNLSMIECFFSARYAGRSDLFEGLSIWKEDKYRIMQGSYPVIRFSFTEIKGSKFRDTREGMIATLQELYEKHSYLLQGDTLNDNLFVSLLCPEGLQNQRLSLPRPADRYNQSKHTEGVPWERVYFLRFKQSEHSYYNH